MVKEIVFLVRWPITPRDAKRFGFEYLRAAGFSLRVFDVSLLLNKEALRRHPQEEAIDAGYVRRFGSFQELDELVKAAAPACAFIDCIMGLDGMDFASERVFRILKKHGAQYHIVSGGALPVYGAGGEGGFSSKPLFEKLRKAANPEKLFNFLARRAILFLTRHAKTYPLPERVFSGDSGILKRYLTARGMGADRVVPIHSLDYDTYLEFMRGACFKAPAAEKTCVFLDEAATHHDDFTILGLKPINEKEYFGSLNRFFRLVEEKTGLRVVVAAHPRSKYEAMPGVFGGRDIVKGKTVELVAKSSLVLAHSSTAVSFAVLFDKPLMITKTDEMIGKGYSGFIDVMAASLGLRAVNIDDTAALGKTAFDLKGMKGAGYEEYKYKYVKSRNAVDATVWETVAGELRRPTGGSRMSEG